MRAKTREWGALAIALLALFVALGGPGYATTTAGRVFAANSDRIDGYHASAKPKPKTLLPLDKRGKLPASVLPASAVGPAGPRGDTGTQGPKGDTGAKGDQGSPGTINGVAAGGDLNGTYPNPLLKSGSVSTTELATDARGVALAGAVIGPDGAVETYFNRYGGMPTVTHSAAGWYQITFPGMTAWYISTPPQVTLIGTSNPGLVSSSTSGGTFYVVTFNSSGTSTDHRFLLTCVPMSLSG
jgi:hypothetical protein